jgi:AcrR family transcriptional regulator
VSWAPRRRASSADPQAIAERRRIRDAAYELALEHGLTDVTAAAVCGRAGLDSAAFELHYSDVEACLLEIYDEAAAEMLSRLEEAVAREPTWLEQMRSLGQAMIEFLLEDQRRARFLVVEVSSGGDRIRVARERDVKAICAMVDRGRLELDDPDSVGPDTALAAVGGIFLRVRQKVLSGQFDSAYETVPEFMHTLVLPYLGEEAALAELRRPAPSPPQPNGEAE